MPTFEEILAEADATLAKAKRAAGKPRSAVTRGEDPARENLYIPHRNVYQFYASRCRQCGCQWDEFDGIYEERRHPKLGHTHWVRLEALPTTSLPRARETKEVSVPYCKECADAPPQVG